MQEHEQHSANPILFPSLRTGGYWSPDAVSRTNRKLLAKAGIEERVRFRGLRHTFATTALEHGMDVKTLSAIIGHSEAFEPHETMDDQLPAEDGKPPVCPPFAPYKGKVRKPGTGGIY